MNTLKSQFVTYEIALKLKELGFDEECFCTYYNRILSRNPSHKIDATPIQGKPYVWKNSKVHNSIVCAPLWQQAIDWFWNNYKILVYTYLIPDKTKTIMWVTKYQHEDFWSTKEQAILKAIELCKKN